jgi:hypothetical protein
MITGVHGIANTMAIVRLIASRPPTRQVTRQAGDTNVMNGFRAQVLPDCVFTRSIDSADGAPV